MKTLILTLLGIIFITPNTFAQYYKTRNGNIQFEASVMGFEEVKAKTNAASAILNSSTGEFATIVFINAFQFKIGLMQEHFNENYMESERFPKASFKGKFKNFDANKALKTDGQLVLDGELTIHGVTKSIQIECKLDNNESSLILNGEFMVHPEDFNIQIPKLVQNKVAKTVKVSFKYNLKP
ncbi:YceI family protein [Xanthomarina gelatinilytica]|nr:YceI family protein [Xanthomarina gelatinilytica]